MTKALLTAAIALSLLAPFAARAAETPPTAGQMPDPMHMPNIEQERAKAGCDARAQADKMVASGQKLPDGFQEAMNNLPSADSCAKLQEQSDRATGGDGGPVAPTTAVDAVQPVQ